ncbi:class F sortase [Streptoalloteichus tenebrarius]|uniref:class F sortase n=1 Tax=Streptoalloteichus tenebrarius (strain ATCC 17920 / DSM 40477 / JCM 4838 / CBS 697.72 / NBRC 16177 / NCIMB 11028 / NRRL B-12390 / A12253. 1 / ISP 5477) TaxID=1933 RepID=UPI003555C4F9
MFLALAAAVLVAAGVTTFVLVDRSTSPSAASESANPSAPSAEAEATTTTTVRGQQPGTVRLAQGGTARLVRREVTADGTLPIPEGLDEATWWGAGLGAPAGASVLAGHVNWKGAKGPFDELWRAEKGQRVEVVDTSGRRWTYQVSEIVTVHKDDLPARAEALFGQDGRHRLVLVTCGGDYVGGTDGYRDNRIVVAEPAA